jgi:hypothetical protein
MLETLGKILLSVRSAILTPGGNTLSCSNGSQGGSVAPPQYDGNTLTIDFTGCAPIGGPAYTLTGRLTIQNILANASTISATINLTAIQSATGRFQISSGDGNTLIAEMSVTGDMSISMAVSGADIQLSAAVPFDIRFAGAGATPSVTYTLGPLTSNNNLTFNYNRTGDNITVNGTVTGIPTDTTVVNLTTTAALGWAAGTTAPINGVLDVTAGSDGTNLVLAIDSASDVTIDITNGSGSQTGSCSIMSSGLTLRRINWSDLLNAFAGLPQDQSVTCA